MLANLLPGIRELRAPLASGYLWLVLMWIIVSPQLPESRNESEGLVKYLYELSSVISSEGVGVVVLSFAAYVAGLIANGVTLEPLRKIGGLLPGGVGSILSRKGEDALDDLVRHFVRDSENGLRRAHSIGLEQTRLMQEAIVRKIQQDSTDLRTTPEATLTIRFKNAIGLIIEEIAESYIRAQSSHPAWAASMDLNEADDHARLLQRVLASAPDWPASSEASFDGLKAEMEAPFVESYQDVGDEFVSHIINELRKRTGDCLEADLREKVQDELHLVSKRLIGDQNDLFSQYDRLRAESDFRLALVTPITALIITALALEGWLWSLAAVIPFLLFRQGVLASRQSGDLIADALSLERVRAPVLERARADLFDR
jgi:hypothetical protein